MLKARHASSCEINYWLAVCARKVNVTFKLHRWMNRTKILIAILQTIYTAWSAIHWCFLLFKPAKVKETHLQRARKRCLDLAQGLWQGTSIEAQLSWTRMPWLSAVIEQTKKEVSKCWWCLDWAQGLWQGTSIEARLSWTRMPWLWGVIEQTKKEVSKCWWCLDWAQGLWQGTSIEARPSWTRMPWLWGVIEQTKKEVNVGGVLIWRKGCGKEHPSKRD